MAPPSEYQWNALFRSYAMCTLLLFIKYFFVQMYSANMNNHPEEDKMLPSAPVPENIKRRERMFANDTENIPFHMVVLWGAFVVQCYANLTDEGKNETIALTVLMCLYTLCRILHSVFYAFALQPFRTISFVLANFTVAAVAIVMVVSAFQVDTDSFLEPGNRKD
eukprot:CAMPEP_0174959850 /NCGR_PEP_ID=MMETSP0004_2-20121128/3397_1 /TAXON_ID=420556 /ORGANISM="Ochromonas sp., Strain CCMP1393" /LENGTH=164 /DNA_ID=CAMNT_0016208197 /DNA_START=41 /DNA_END=535 /DNA_ORIENTATION=+